jgi:ribose transport system ATP-binding protein
MLGRELSSAYDDKPAHMEGARGGVRLSVRGLTRRGIYEDVSFDLHAGEVLGIAGVQGSGREALCRTLFGAEDADSGEFLVDGTLMRFAGPAAAIRAGIAYLPAERRAEGIIGGLSVKENMTLAHLPDVMRGPIIDRRRENDLARGWIERLHIRTRSPDTPAANLSGGNQQKVVLTKWLLGTDTSILILDHPMRGLDVGAKAEIFELVRELARTGMGILLIADTLEELMVMRDGRISARYSAAETEPTQLQILEHMV